MNSGFQNALCHRPWVRRSTISGTSPCDQRLVIAFSCALNALERGLVFCVTCLYLYILSFDRNKLFCCRTVCNIFNVHVWYEAREYRRSIGGRSNPGNISSHWRRCDGPHYTWCPLFGFSVGLDSLNGSSRLSYQYFCTKNSQRRPMLSPDHSNYLLW